MSTTSTLKPGQISLKKIAGADGCFGAPGKALTADEKRVLLNILRFMKEKNNWVEFSYRAYFRESPHPQHGDEGIIETSLIKERGWLEDLRSDGLYTVTEKLKSLLLPYI